MGTRFRTSVLRVERCGADVLLISLARPDGYDYRAGQWFRLFLTTPDGEQARTFSLASQPGEPDLLMATRLSESAFKQALADVIEGDAVEISAPGGRLALPADALSVVFLTGGVGVTPVRSLLCAAAAEGRRFEDALVLFGVRDASCAPYRPDLEALTGIGVRVVTVCEHPDAAWDGESGFITAAMVRRHAGDVDERWFVVTGPPAMVGAMELVLDELGVSGERRIVERFGAAAPRA